MRQQYIYSFVRCKGIESQLWKIHDMDFLNSSYMTKYENDHTQVCLAATHHSQNHLSILSLSLGSSVLFSFEKNFINFRTNLVAQK